MKKTIADEVDLILRDLLNGTPCSDNFDNSDLRKSAIRVSKALKLIGYKNNTNTEFELLENGVLVINDGGIIKYITILNKEKTLDSSIKVLTSKKLKYDIWYNLLYISVGSILGFGFSSLNEGNTLKSIELLNKSVNEINVLNDNYQKHLNDKNTLILSLQKEIDSLKSQ